MVTIREIAQKAGVSIGTVDRALHNRGRVSKATQERISRIIAECRYKPNVFASHLSLAKKYTFAVLTPEPEQDGRYWELPMRGIRKAADELKPYPIRIWPVHYDKYSESSFFKAGEKILKSKSEVDGLVVAPVLSAASETFVRRIPPALPYVFIDSYVPDTSCLSRIAQNPYRSGALGARLMDLLIGGKGTVAVCRIVPRDYHIDDRVNGFTEALRFRKDVEIVSFEADRRTDEAVFYHLAERILAERPSCNGIFVPNSLGHQVAQLLKERVPPGRIHLIGYDLVEPNLPFLKEGWIRFLISQRPDVQGYQGIQLLVQHLLLKNPVPAEMNLPIDIVTAENLDEHAGTDPQEHRGPSAETRETRQAGRKAYKK